ncbi:MAG TPA: hypothetical protein VK171_08025 [Fimbriimonas sp.]|nr:hypothetical protein [Fimbriimonas sp.]
MPCTYTTDGKIIRTWKDDGRGDFVFSIDGKQPGFSPVRNATNQIFSAPPVIASKSIIVPQVLFYSDPQISKDGGELVKLPKNAPTGESLLVTSFRKAGLFEPNSPSAIFRDMRLTKDDRMIAQFWSNYDIYQGMGSRFGKLFEYKDDNWAPLAEFNNYSLNTEYYVAPSGVIGANWIANCSYASRPVILDAEKLNILPIPEGFVYAQLDGVNKDGSAVITATGQGRTTKGFLWCDSKFYPFEAISKQLRGKLLFSRYGPALPRNAQAPDKFEALRSKLQNPLLENGDMVFMDAEKDGKFYLVSKTVATARSSYGTPKPTSD